MVLDRPLCWQLGVASSRKKKKIILTIYPHHANFGEIFQVACIKDTAYIWIFGGKISLIAFLILLLVIPGFLIFAAGRKEPACSLESGDQKKILVLSSNGGYGHMAAASTLKGVLGKKYQISIIYPIDQLRIWGVEQGEQIYNVMLQFGWIRSVNMIAKHIAPKLFRTRKRKIEKMISEHIDREKPNLVISLIPFVNSPACEAARKKNIPYLLITTDNDLRNWVHGLQSISHPQFKVTIGNDLPTTREMLRQRKIPDSAIEMTGLPLRPDFRSTKGLGELHAEYGVPAEKPVILIMMGGAGAKGAVYYTKRIGRMDLGGVHLVVCAGKNEGLAKKLKEIRIHPKNSITVMGFTDKVADLMAMADLIVTKPGPGTINEAMAMRLPLLIDNTKVPLSWEKANIDMVLKYGIGDSIKDHEDTKVLVSKYLKDPIFLEKTKNAFSKVPPNLFHERIESLVDSMCKL